MISEAQEAPSPRARHRVELVVPGALVAPGALLVYVALAFGVFASAWRDPTVRGIGIAGDPQSFMWFLAWFPYALGHGLAPFFSNFGDYPAGANLLWDTALPLITVLLWPVTAAFGPVVAYDLMVTLALALSAWSGFLLLRRSVRSPVAAGLGGLLYGFSPYMLAQSLAHPQMTMAFMPPLILLLLDEIVRVQRRSPVLLGAALALAGAAQFFIAEEVLVITGVTAAVLLVTAGALWPHELVPRVRFAAAALAVAFGLFAVTMAWPVAFQLFGPQHITGNPHQQNIYVNDLLGFWVPTQIVWIAPVRALRISAQFMGNLSEWNAYVGIPMALLLGFTAIRQWSNGWVRLAVLAGSVVAILSLGITVHVAGSVKAWLPVFTVSLLFLLLPGGVPARVLVLLTFGLWLALWRLPVVSSLVSARLMLLVYLMAGLVLAVFVDRLAGVGRLRLALGVGALALVLATLFPRLPYMTTSFQEPAFFAPGGQVSRVPAGSVAVIAPVVSYGDADAVRWQATSGMRFRMPEGYLFSPAPPPLVSWPPTPPTVTTNALLQAGAGDRTGLGDPALRSAIRLQLAGWHVRTMVVGPMANQDTAVALLTWVLGRPPQAVQGVYVWWDVDSGLS
jgi:hypothetical protein